MYYSNLFVYEFVLLVLSDSLFAIHQLVMFPNSLFRFSNNSFVLLFEENMLASSANIIGLKNNVKDHEQISKEVMDPGLNPEGHHI